MITTSLYEERKLYYDNILNKDAALKSINNVATPLSCVEEMVSKLPSMFWDRENLKILDPVCGNGNFHTVIYNKLINNISPKHILENILYFNDIDSTRTSMVNTLFESGIYNLNVTTEDFIEYDESQKFDLVVASPPYYKLLPNGKRSSKNNELINPFIDKTLKILKPEGYLLFITPNNWMSNKNTYIGKLTRLQIIHLNINASQKYFKTGHSYTWYLIKNIRGKRSFTVDGIRNGVLYTSKVKSEKRKYIPFLYNELVQSILHKTLDNKELIKFKVETSSKLHTKKKLISIEKDENHPHRLAHTPTQMMYSSKAHKYQEGYKVFISINGPYSVWVDNCGMTQSVAFIRCKNKKEADKISTVLRHPLYKFLNNICKGSNSNNVRILQSFPAIQQCQYNLPADSIWDTFDITDSEKEHVNSFA